MTSIQNTPPDIPTPPHIPLPTPAKNNRFAGHHNYDDQNTSPEDAIVSYERLCYKITY